MTSVRSMNIDDRVRQTTELRAHSHTLQHFKWP